MSQSPDHSSDAGSDYNWPIDLNLEQIQHEQVLFENVAEEYVKGDDITIFFTILNDGKVNSDEDRIGLTRIGCTNMKECLLYAPVQVTPSTGTGSVRHGTATFASTSLPDTDNEFYQFIYINNKHKSLGSSLPFQLNCSSIEATLLSNGKINKGDRLITVADQDEADMLVISTQRMLTEEKLRVENRQLLDIKRRLESEQEEFRVKLEALQIKGQQRTNHMEQEHQALVISHQTVLEELTARKQSEQKILVEFEKTRLLCEEYHRDCLQHVERCQTLEVAQGKLLQEANQLRSQLAVTSQFTKDQATQIIDLERRLMQSNELTKTANQRQATLEQQLRDQCLTAEKRLLSLEGENQLKSQIIEEQKDRIEQLQRENQHLKVDIEQLTEENQQLAIKAEEQQRISEQSRRQLEQTDAEYYSAQNQVKTLRTRIEEMNADQEVAISLKNAVSMMEQRCLKYRNGELEAKKALTEQKTQIDALRRDNDDLRARLQSAEEMYKTVYRQCVQLQHNNSATVEIPKLINAAEHTDPEDATLLNMLGDANKTNASDKDDEDEEVSGRPIIRNDREEIRICPMCYMEFPANASIETKQEHIENHFQ